MNAGPGVPGPPGPPGNHHANPTEVSAKTTWTAASAFGNPGPFGTLKPLGPGRWGVFSGPAGRPGPLQAGAGPPPGGSGPRAVGFRLRPVLKPLSPLNQPWLPGRGDRPGPALDRAGPGRGITCPWSGQLASGASPTPESRSNLLWLPGPPTSGRAPGPCLGLVRPGTPGTESGSDAGVTCPSHETACRPPDVPAGDRVFRHPYGPGGNCPGPCRRTAGGQGNGPPNRLAPRRPVMRALPAQIGTYSHRHEAKRVKPLGPGPWSGDPRFACLAGRSTNRPLEPGRPGLRCWNLVSPDTGEPSFRHLHPWWFPRICSAEIEQSPSNQPGVGPSDGGRCLRSIDVQLQPG